MIWGEDEGMALHVVMVIVSNTIMDKRDLLHYTVPVFGLIYCIRAGSSCQFSSDSSCHPPFALRTDFINLRQFI